MTNHEQAFWNSLASSLASSWDIKMAFQRNGAPTFSTSEVDQFIYAVDVETGWRRAAGLSGEQVRLMEGIVRRMPEQIQRSVQSAAASAIVQAADPGAPIEDLAEQIKAVLAAFTLTNTFLQLQARFRPGSSVHMIYMIYKCRDGHLIGRPVGAIGAGTGLMSTSDLDSYVAQAVQADTTAGTSSVQQMLQAHGGPKLPR